MPNRIAITIKPLLAVVVALPLLALPGCSLGIMAGKMLFGDPMATSEFSAQTGIKLEESDKSVLILCTAPHAIKMESPSIEHDILDGVARRLRLRNVKIVDPDKVADWLDENGAWETLTDIAVPLKADYVAHMDLTMVSYHEDNSPTLYRGRALGNVYTYEIDDSDGTPTALEVFRREFKSTYPFGPISADNTSAEMFKKDYIDRLCDLLAMKFYDHKIAAEID